MTDSTTQTKAIDPLGAVADAMQKAAASVQSAVGQGISGASQVTSEALPRAGLFLNRFVYTACYTVSYGVVFPVALVALSVPRNNAFVQGIVDGSKAARHKVDDVLGPSAVAGSSPPVS